MVIYSEFDPGAAEWLRELMKAGLIPEGVVDERDIRDVLAADLTGFRSCHFFAGIGGWPYALRLAGWPDGRPVWTGSCPCQPFSSAGKRQGAADARHLWPEFYRLIAESRPATVFGEQVASNDGLAWLAGVRADLEAAGYAVGAADLCAAGVGAPHIRQRLYWVADSRCGERRGRAAFAGSDAHRFGRHATGTGGAGRLAESAGDGDSDQCVGPGPAGQHVGVLAGTGGGVGRGDRTARGGGPAAIDEGAAGAGGLADPECAQRRSGDADERGVSGRDGDRLEDRSEGATGTATRRGAGRVADADGGLAGDGGLQPGREHGQQSEDGRVVRVGNADCPRKGAVGGVPSGTGAERPGSAGGVGDATTSGRKEGIAGKQQAEGSHRARPADGGDAGFWSAYDLIPCRDGKARRVEPGTFPLAHGVPGRVAALRGYGNAINPWTAAAFIRAYLDVTA